MAKNLRDRGYGSSMDDYNAHKRKVEERKEQEKTTGPVSTLRLPKVNSTASGRAASTSAPIQTQRFYDPNVTRATPGTGGGRGTPHITEQEFNRSTAMTRSYGNYNNYLNGIHVTGSGFADPDQLFSNEPDLKAVETAQDQFDHAMSVVSGNFEQKASAYERWYRTITNQYQPMSDAQKAQGDQLYADYMKSLDAYQKMSDAHMKASASNAGVYADVSNRRRQWYDSIRDEKDIDVEEKDLMSQLDLLEDQKYKVQSESSYAKTQTLHGITTAQGLETVMNSTDELDRLDRQIDEVKAQLELLNKERAYSRYFKWQEMANNNMPVSARRMQGGAPSWLDKIISGTATEEEIMQAINEGNINPSNIAEMLDDEKQTYRAIYEQYGPAKAKEYVDELERYGNIRDSLNTRRRMTDETKLRDWVQKGSPFGRQLAASVLTVLASPTKVFSYVGQGADYLFSGEMTKDADYNVFSYAPNAVTAQIGENITKWGEEHGLKWVEKWGEFGYQTALSMATFLYTTALTGGLGLSQETMYGVELYNQGYRTAEAVSAYKAFKTAETLSLGLMGTEAAADAVMQAKDRGLDDGQAFWMGTAAGAIEILTEKFSVENLLEGVGDRNRLLYFLKSMFTEGSEEVASDFSNMLVDSLVAKDKSEFNQAVKTYMKEYGVSKQEALKAVWTDQLKSVGLSGLGGAISGGFMGGGKIVRSNVSNLFNRSAITSPDNVANIVNRAQGLNEWSAGARSASSLQKKLDAGERLTIREVLKARNAIETDRKTDPKYVGALIEAAQDYGDSDAKKQADKLQANLDNGKVKVEDVEKLEEAIDLERLVDPNREDLQSALKYGETADQKSEAYKLTKGVRDKIAAGERLSLEEVSAAESAVNTAKATSAEGLKSTIESGLASDQNSPAYKSAQQLQSKLDNGTEITLAEVNEAKRAVRAAENAAFKSLDPNVVGKYLVTENGRKALTDAATILKNSTAQSDVQRGNQILQAIKDGNLDAKTAGEAFLRSQKILENTEKQTARVLQPREVTADMDAYDRSAAKLGVSVEEAAHNKAIMQAFGVEGEYKSFENNNLSAYYDRSTGKVYINANADNPGLALIAHEVTHSFENTAGYKKLANLVFSQSKDLNADLQRITQEYKDAGIDLDDDGARSELVSEFVEQHMFNDEKFINDVVSTDRSLGQKILRTLDNLLAKLGNKNAQQRQLLRHARDLWAEALQQRKTSDEAKAKIAEKRSDGKLTLPTAKAAAVRKTEGPNLPKAESRKIQAANAELNQYGINIDADSGAAVSYSIRTAPTTVDEIKLATDRLVNAGFDRADAESWLKSLTSVSSVIMQNMQGLNYEADERYTWLKTNSEYTQGSVDFNNNCPKRAQFTAVFDRLQQMIPDRVFSASDYETIRQILIKHNISVTCGPCFVEDRRQHTGEIAQKFIDQLKSGELKNKFRAKIGNDTYIPTQYDLVTYEGLRGLYDSHRGIHDAFVAFNNARGMQAARLLEGLAEYNNQIKKWNKRTISSKNSKGGLRIFSLSDADPRNMIDMIQIVTDSAEKGLMIQGYTKKPWFARFIKDTGVRILRSHIPAGNGVLNGKLVFDNVEGINTNDPDYFDATNERNIGDTVIGINDEMIRIAMLDPNIDQIIPFHTQLAKDIRDQKKIGHWTPYNGLEDRNVSDGKKAKKQINIYKDVLEAWEKKGTPITNRQEFVEAFLQVCDERGLIPRFDKFLNVDENGKYVYTPGYEKFLVDYKLFDRTTGEIIPQEAVKPIFDDAYNQSVLENYIKDARGLPKVSEDVFDEIKRHFTDGKLSLPKVESKQYAISKSDTAYLKAVESGDMDTAQRMVDEAAASAMPNSVVRDKDGNLLRMHHGTDADFTVFDRGRIGQRGRFEGSGFNFTPYDGRARGYGKNVLGGYLNIESPLSAAKKTISITKLEDIIRNVDPTGDNIIANYARDTNDYGSKSFVEREARTTARAIWKWANNDVDIYSELSAVSPDSDSLIEYFSNAGYDGVIHYDKDGRIRTAVAFDSNQFKLADPVTYDDSGNPIPLSERFNPDNPDIRYAINKDATIRTEGELIDSVIDPKEAAKAGVQDAVDAFIDSVDTNKEIPGKTAIRTSSKSRGKPSDNGRFLYRKMLDSGEAVSRLGRYANDSYLYPYYNMARASSNAAISMIQNAQTDVMGRRVGDSLNDIFSAIRAKGDEYYSDLQLYLYHLHNIARMSRANPGAVATAQDEYEAWRKENPEFAHMLDSDIKRIAYDPTSYYQDQARQGADIIHRLEVAQAIQNKPIFGYEVSAEVSRESAARLREKLEQTDGFEEDVEKIKKYIDNLMQYRIDSGLFTEENYEKLKKIYPDYVPVFYEYESESKKGRKENRTEVGSTVGRAQGVAQETPIMPLHKALAQQTMSAVREGSKNRFGQRLLEKQNLSRNMIKGIDTLLADFNEETFDQPDAKRQNAFVVRMDGKRYEMTLGKDLYEAIDVLSPTPQETHKLIEIYHKGFDLFKAGVTGYNPVFAVKNPIRDLQDAGLYSKDLSEFVKQYPKTAKEIRKNGKYWQLYQAMGGLYSSVFDYEKGELEEHSWLRRNSLDRMEALNMAIEQAPRLAEFMATIKKAEARGEVTMDDLMEAVHNAADVTVNFGRSGKWGKWLNRNVLPFFNPGIQGADKFVRRFTETKGAKDWLRLTGKAALFGIAPAILNSLLWGKRKDWDELKQSDRDNYYLFPIPWKEGVWLRLPKGRALALFGMATDRLIQGKDADWASFITTGYSNLGPSNPLKTNFLTPLLEADLFDPDSPGTTWYGGDIESQRLQNLAPGERYDASTDALSKWLGKTFNLSPKKINYILDQYSGVIGDILIPLTSSRAEKDLFSAAFTIDSVASNRLSNDFYKLNDELTWAKNDPESGPEDSIVSKYWAKQTSAISDINKAIRAIEEDKSLTDKEKRDMIRAQYALRNGIMRNAMDTLDDYRKAVEDAYAKSTKTDPDDRADEAYREANKNMFGAEYALQTYNKKVYEAATQLRNDNGISYDGFYKFYFARQEVQDQPGTSAECELIMKQDMNDSQKQALYEKYISQKPITLEDGMSMDDFLQAKIDKAAAASEPKISDVMETQAKQNNPNWDSMDSKQQKYATWDETAKSGNDLTSSMSDSEARKYQTATDHGIDTDVFVNAYKAVDQADLDNDANRSYKQEEVKTALDSMDLTNEQRAVLWQVISSAKSGKNNPYDPELGQQIYDEMQASKSAAAGSQTKPAPIRPMGLRLPKIG